MRCFVAVRPPQALGQSIAQVVSPPAAGMPGRWVPPQNLHITLAFLGEVPDTRAPAVVEAMARAADPVHPFPVELQGLGVFPNLRRARVAFLHAAVGEEQLAAVAETLMASLPVDLRPQQARRFRGHLTLARFREPPDSRALANLAAVLRSRRFHFLVGSLLLMESEMSPEGSRYGVRREVAFLTTSS